MLSVALANMIPSW